MRYFCSATGAHVETVELYPGRSHASLYVQSLRGDPFSDTKLAVLVSHP